jgi:hypothetical protein
VSFFFNSYLEFSYLWFISIKDEDGDVLLIEAADWLPDWIDSETSYQRVFVYQGNLHIIPLSITSSNVNLKDIDSISYMLSILIQFKSQTKASDEIQKALFQKWGAYPQKAMNHLHRVKVIVPKTIAMLLHHDPTLISYAIECFLTRDSIDLKVLHLFFST